MKNKNKPIRKKEEVAKSADNKIDEDFSGFPHGPASEETIKPETKLQRKLADMDKKDGEKRTGDGDAIDEQDSDGSANAFEDK